MNLPPMLYPNLWPSTSFLQTSACLMDVFLKIQWFNDWDACKPEGHLKLAHVSETTLKINWRMWFQESCAMLAGIQKNQGARNKLDKCVVLFPSLMFTVVGVLSAKAQLWQHRKSTTSTDHRHKLFQVLPNQLPSCPGKNHRWVINPQDLLRYMASANKKSKAQRVEASWSELHS